MCSHRSLPHNNGFRTSFVQMLLRVSLRFCTFCFDVDSCSPLQTFAVIFIKRFIHQTFTEGLQHKEKMENN